MNQGPAEQLTHIPAAAHESFATTRQTKRLQTIATAMAISLAALLPGCVYQRRDSNRPNPFDYTHRDTKVVFPWRVTDEFSREYQLKFPALIVIWFAFPYEFLKGLEKLDIARMLGSPFPAIFHAFENDDGDIKRFADSAREQREERERSTRAEQIRASEGR